MEVKIEKGIEVKEVVFKPIESYGKQRKFVHAFEINKNPVVGGGDIFVSNILQRMIVVYDQ